MSTNKPHSSRRGKALDPGKKTIPPLLVIRFGALDGERRIQAKTKHLISISVDFCIYLWKAQMEQLPHFFLDTPIFCTVT